IYSSEFIDANTGIIATGKQILRTTNGGLNWKVILITDANYLYFYNQNTGFALVQSRISYRHSKVVNYYYKTTNAGLNWAKVFIVDTVKFCDIYFVNESTGYLSTINNNIAHDYWRLYKTTDGGSNWFLHYSPNYQYVYSICFTDYNTGYAVGNRYAVKKTTNGGSNWVEQYGGNCGLDGTYIRFLNRDTGFAVGVARKIIYTYNGGINWNVTEISEWASASDFCFSNSLTGYFSLSNGNVYKTTNTGQTWNIQKTNQLSLYSITAVGKIVNVFGRGGSIAKSTNAGLNWTSLINSFTRTNYNNLDFINSSTGYLCGDKGSLLRTTDKFNSWIEIVSDTSFNFIDCQFLNQNTGYSVGKKRRPSYPNDYAVFKTTNGGYNWVSVFQLQSSWTHEGIHWIYFINENTGFRQGVQVNPHHEILYRTTNGGYNWTLITYPIEVMVSDMHFVNSFTGYVVGYGTYAYGAVLLKTTNAGINWFNSDVNKMVSAGKVYFINENTGYYSGSMYTHTTNHYQRIAKTTNAGVNWQLCFSEPNYNSVWYSDFYPIENRIYLSGGTTGLIYSTNYGLTWKSSYSNTLYSKKIFFADLFNGIIIGEDGLIERTTDGGIIFANNNATKVTSSYKLYQNYPNPFNPTTNIKFDLKKSSHTKLIIYDILGKEVATLVDDKLNAGSYEVGWDASHYPSGVYFYRIIADDYVATKKMLFIK
ncbi:YCF48-related protein, partial [Bacteroidota bacterium]